MQPYWIRNVAEMCHEVNRAYCEATGDAPQLPWAESPEWQQKSIIHGVEAVLHNPSITPEESHVSWLKEKEREGWKYGEVKDPEKKEHPNMVPYSDLSEGQRAKDAIFLAVVKTAMRIWQH